MISKIQTILITSLQKIDKLQIKGMPMVMVYLFLCLLIVSILLFIGAWVWQWTTTGRPEMSLMIQFISTITSVSSIGALGFFGRALAQSDENHNGINDEFEKHDRPPFPPPLKPPKG